MNEVLHHNEHKLVDTGTTCTLNNAQCITIPVHIRKTLSFSAGDEATVSLASNPNEFIIQKKNCETFDNIMIITGRGSIRIPVEIKRALCLHNGDKFHIYLSIDEQFILLKHANNTV